MSYLSLSTTAAARVSLPIDAHLMVTLSAQTLTLEVQSSFHILSAPSPLGLCPHPGTLPSSFHAPIAMSPKRLLENLPGDGSAAKLQRTDSRRRLARRDTEEQVREAQRRHLKSVSDVDLHHKKVNGQSLHEALVEFKRSHSDEFKKGCRFTPKVMAEMKARFGINDFVEELVVTDPTLPVAPSLLSALHAATNANCAKRTRAPLQQYFEHAMELNQKEVIGVVRHMLTVSIGGNKKARDLVLACMRMVRRCDALGNFRSEWKFLQAFLGCHLSLERYPLLVFPLRGIGV